MRYLALDLGQARTGVAVGGDATGIASPLGVIEGPASSLVDRLKPYLEAHAPDALVIGLPLNMDGTEGPAAARARERAGRLESALRLPVHLVDERLTSDEADTQMAQSGLTHGGKKARRDALAAAAILRRFLDARRR